MEIKALTIGETKGLNTDIVPVNLSPDIFSGGNNFRCVRKAVVSFNGKTDLMYFADPITPSKIACVVSSDIAFYVVMGTTSIIASNGTNFYNISSGAYSVTAKNWDFCNDNQVPVFNNPDWYPEYWDPISGSQLLQPLPFSATDTWETALIHANLIRSHKNFLFALGTVEGAVEKPTTFRWSAPADNGSIPFTWDETDLSTIAGVSVLQGNYGRIVDGLTLRDTFVIYSESGISILHYVGGEFIWNVVELSNTYGILAKNCAVYANQRHYVITQDDIIVHDGTNVVSLLHNRMRVRVRAALGSTHAKNAYVLSDYSKKEVWFCIVEASFTLPNLAVIYNWEDDTFSIRDLGSNFSSMIYAPLISSTVQIGWNTITSEYDTATGSWANMIGNSAGQEPAWDDQAGEWELSPFNWNYVNDIPILGAIIGINPANSIVSALTIDDGSADLDATLLHEDFVFDNMLSVSTIVSLYPMIQCNGQMSIQVGSKYNLGADTMWKPAVIYDPSKSKKVDIRSTGVYHSWKFSSIGNTPFGLSGFTFYYANNGQR